MKATPPPPPSSRRFSAGSVPLTVEMVDGAAVTLRWFADASSSELGPLELAALLAVGMVTTDEADEDLVPIAEIEHQGFRFLVGEAELDPAVGWDAIERGLRVAAEAALEDHEADTVRDEPTDAAEPRVAAVTYDEALAGLEDLVDRVAETGEHVVVTRDGEAIAALVPFEWYRATRERLSELDAAYWAAMKGGVWRPDQYGTLVRQVVPAVTTIYGRATSEFHR